MCQKGRPATRLRQIASVRIKFWVFGLGKRRPTRIEGGLGHRESRFEAADKAAGPGRGKPKFQDSGRVDTNGKSGKEETRITRFASGVRTQRNVKKKIYLDLTRTYS